MARRCLYARRNKDGSRTWYLKYRTGDGTQVKRASGRSRKEAERALTTALAGVDRGELRTTDRQSFAEAADTWLVRKRPLIEPATFHDYEIHLRKRLVPAFGHLKLRQVTRGRIEDYLVALDASGRLSRKTINDSLIPLRQILGRAVRDGVLASNPAENADRDAPLALPYESPTMQYLNRDDARSYLAACSDWYRPLAEVLIGAGLRIGEAIALEWRDVDWDGHALNVVRAAKDSGIGTPKGDRPRSVLVAPYLLDLLHDHRSSQARGGKLLTLAFTSPRGAMLNRHNVRRRGHDSAVKKAGLSPRCASTTCATPLPRSGWPQGSRSTSSSSSSGTRTSRPRSTSTGTLIEPPTETPPPGRPRGGGRGSLNDAWYHGWYHQGANGRRSRF